MKTRKFSLLSAFLLCMALLLGSCGLLPPTPSNEEILEAIKISNMAQSEPLELVYEELHVAHCYPGRALAVLWIEDKSIQRNFVINYDRQTRTFQVAAYETLVLGEDNTYRKKQP